MSHPLLRSSIAQYAPTTRHVLRCALTSVGQPSRVSVPLAVLEHCVAPWLPKAAVLGPLATIRIAVDLEQGAVKAHDIEAAISDAAAVRGPLRRLSLALPFSVVKPCTADCLALRSGSPPLRDLVSLHLRFAIVGAEDVRCVAAVCRGLRHLTLTLASGSVDAAVACAGWGGLETLALHRDAQHSDGALCRAIVEAPEPALRRTLRCLSLGHRGVSFSMMAAPVTVGALLISCPRLRSVRGVCIDRGEIPALENVVSSLPRSVRVTPTVFASCPGFAYVLPHRTL